VKFHSLSLAILRSSNVHSQYFVNRDSGGAANVCASAKVAPTAAVRNASRLVTGFPSFLRKDASRKGLLPNCGTLRRWWKNWFYDTMTG
jgi:hypothetical protein